jgi:LAS superfamily LD-carboxypeptidase LdcB
MLGAADPTGATSLPSLAKIVSAVLIAGIAVSQSVPAANADDPAAKRRQVQTQRAQAAAKLDVLRASQGQIQHALDELDRNIRSQQAAVAAASQAAEAAAAALQDARAREAKTAVEVAGLHARAADLAIDAYEGKSASATLEALRTGSLADIERRREYVSLAMGDSSATLDRLRAAREDLLAQRRRAQRAKDQASARRADVQSHLGALSLAQRQQVQFAGNIENKIAATTSQSDQLARADSQLAAQIAARSAAQSVSVSRAGNISLTTVRGITVNSSIAAQLDKMLGAAEADGFVFTGQGYRDPNQQLAVRRANCGSSDYAVYQMPPNDCHPPTALPGTSMHEQGLAIDFIWDGSLISSHGSPAWQWLSGHAATYGFYNLPSESWHWSVNGR